MSGPPALALIHGWGLASTIWQPFIEPLAKHCTVHVVDLPGYGQAAWAYPNFADAALALIDALPAGVILCGWSLGAMLAMRAALLAPQRVAGLVLIGATASFTQRADWCAAQPPQLLASFAANVSDHPEQTLQRFIALLNQGDTQARAISRRLIASRRNSRLPAAAALACGLDWLRDVDLRALVPAISARSLLIHGENDALNPLAAARWLAQSLPDCRLEVFAGAAHAPFLADPQRFLRLLEEFCAATSS